MEQAFVIVTGEGFTREVDTVISGHAAAKFAHAHKRMLNVEFDCKVTVYMIEGADLREVSTIADTIADIIRDGKPLGRKAFARLSTETARVGFALFSESVSARLG